MKDIKESLIFAIYLLAYLCAWLIIYVYVNHYSGYKNINHLEKENRILVNQIDSLKNDNQKLQKEVTMIVERVDSLKTKDVTFKKMYDENQNKIQSLESKYKKISIIDSFSSEDIRKYFSNIKKR